MCMILSYHFCIPLMLYVHAYLHSKLTVRATFYSPPHPSNQFKLIVSPVSYKSVLVVQSSFSVVKLHGPSMFAIKAKIYGVLYNQASIAFDETSTS